MIQSPCPNCSGQGRVKLTSKIKVKIPAGVDTGSQLRLRGEGEAGTASRGDLFVIIEVRPNSVFERHENDLVVQVTISMAKAVLGGEVEVPTLDGKVEMKIPVGTQSGKVFRLKDKGIPDVHTRLPGDELVRVNVEIPRNLNAQQRRLMEEFAVASGEKIDDRESFGDKIKKAFK